MKPSEALTAHRDELRQLVSRYGLSRPRVFGWVLTRTDKDESDLDLLVEPGRSTSLLTIAGLKIDAEKLLGVPVSVLTPNGLPPKFRNEVLQRAQPLCSIRSASKTIWNTLGKRSTGRQATLSLSRTFQLFKRTRRFRMPLSATSTR